MDEDKEYNRDYEGYKVYTTGTLSHMLKLNDGLNIIDSFLEEAIKGCFRENKKRDNNTVNIGNISVTTHWAEKEMIVKYKEDK